MKRAQQTKEIRPNSLVGRQSFVDIDNALSEYRRSQSYDKAKVERIEDMVNAFNPTIYIFNVDMLTLIQNGKVGIFLDTDFNKKVPNR